jgi:hypothetical protein
MKKKLFGALFASAAVAAAVIVPATAFAADHSQPGTPGTPNCVGQTTAYVAQLGQSVGAPGIGGVSDFTGLSVQQIHDIIQAYCNQTA